MAFKFKAAQCEARWRGGNLSASYSLLTGCMVGGVPEASIRASPDRIYTNWVR